MKTAVTLTAVLVAAIAATYKMYVEPLCNEFLESDYHNRFFDSRIEYIHLLGLSRPTKYLLSFLPIIEPYVRDHLRRDVDRTSFGNDAVRSDRDNVRTECPKARRAFG